ncbi:MAG: hypothetical protein ACOZCL_04495 [Bacillota bacterium]
MDVGYGVKVYMDKGILGDDLINNAAMYTAAFTAVQSTLLAVNGSVTFSQNSMNQTDKVILDIMKDMIKSA